MAEEVGRTILLFVHGGAIESKLYSIECGHRFPLGSCVFSTRPSGNRLDILVDSTSCRDPLSTNHPSF